MSKHILITGGCGFVGSSLCIEFKNKYPDYHIFALDNLKRRGSELNIKRLKELGIHFVQGDIRNKEDLEFKEKFDTIIDAAAEPSVLAGLSGSTDYLINTNFNGTVNCLNLALKNKSDFIFLSTSRIYPIGSIENIKFEEKDTRFQISGSQSFQGISTKGLSESFPIEGSRSLYGSTKLASELFVKEYQELMGIRAVINRCGVLTGPWQMGKVDQGVIVLWVARHFWKGKLGYFGYGGKGKQVRDILHIKDLFRLLDYQLHNMNKVNGETFNVGGGQEISISLKELTALCEEVTGNKIQIEEVPETRTADIRIYITDNAKVTAATGWTPAITPKEIISDIYNWIKANETELKGILN